MSVKNDNGIIKTFRHSISGKSVGTSIRKLSLVEQALYVETLNRLQDEKPDTQPDWAHAEAWSWWKSKASFTPAPIFDPLLTKPETVADLKREQALEKKLQKWSGREQELLTLLDTERQNSQTLKDEIKNLKALLEKYAKAAGVQSDVEKDFTLAEAYQWALANVKRDTEKQTQKVLTILENLTEVLNPETKWVDLNSSYIVESIEGIISAKTGKELAYNTKRDYRLYCKSWLEDVRKALKFSFNPVEELVVGDVQAGGHDIALVDAREALKLLKAKEASERLTLLVALCGFSGCRLSEGLSMKWENISFPCLFIEKQAKKGGKKEDSRYAFAFSNLKKFLPKGWEKLKGPIFENFYNYDACSEATKILGAAPFNGLRHWHSTEMIKNPKLRVVESKANGHTESESERSYQNNKSLIESIGEINI